MRDFIIVMLVGLAIAVAADLFWLGGRYSGALKHELGLDISAVKRR